MKQYYITGPNTPQTGPFDEEFIREQYAAGAYEEGIHIWTEGMKEWLPIASVIRPRKPEKPTMPTPPKKPVARGSQILDSVPQPTPPRKPVPPTPSPQREAPIPPPHQEEACDVLISEGGQQRGPFSVTTLRQMCKQGEVSEQALYWMPGMTDWKPISELLQNKQQANPFASFNKTLPKLQGFSIGKFFSLVFKRHTREEMLDIFCCGTSKTTPNLMSVDTSWPTPWVFARMFAICLLLYFGFNWGANEFGNTKLIPGIIFVGTFGVPFCIFILFFELNIRRDVSLYDAMKGLIIGGLLSIILSLVFFSHTEAFNEAFGAPWAGPVEETGKLLIAVLVASGLRNGRILTGLLMGASVGAGFAAFESAGYVFEHLMALPDAVIRAQEAILSGEASPQEAAYYLRNIQANWDPDNMLRLRALLAPFCHVLWTAITAGAFWMVHASRVKEGQCQPGQNAYDWAVLKDKRFLLIAVIPVLLHMFNNYDGLLASTTKMFLTTRAIAGVFGWIVALRLVQQGLHQIREEQEKKQRELQPNVSPESI